MESKKLVPAPSSSQEQYLSYIDNSLKGYSCAVSGHTQPMAFLCVDHKCDKEP